MDVGVSLPDLGRRPVTLSDGTLFPPEVVAYVDPPDGPELTVRIVVKGGRPTIESIVIERGDGPELSAPVVDALRIGEVFDRAVAVAASSLARWSGHQQPDAAGAAAVRVRRRRRRLDAEHFDEVAAICRSVDVEMREKGIKARQMDRIAKVQEQLYCGERTAARWIAEAKRLGVLEEEER